MLNLVLFLLKLLWYPVIALVTVILLKEIYIYYQVRTLASKLNMPYRYWPILGDSILFAPNTKTREDVIMNYNYHTHQEDIKNAGCFITNNSFSVRPVIYVLNSELRKDILTHDVDSL